MPCPQAIAPNPRLSERLCRNVSLSVHWPGHVVQQSQVHIRGFWKKLCYAVLCLLG